MVLVVNGGEFKALRLRLGLTQARLAERMGTTETSVRRYERGQQGIPEPIARFLKLVVQVEAQRKPAKPGSKGTR
jgi:transcriptional regulator with XRE-family HTH domain